MVSRPDERAQKAELANAYVQRDEATRALAEALAELVGLRTEVDQLRTDNERLREFIMAERAACSFDGPLPTGSWPDVALQLIRQLLGRRDALQAEVEELRRRKRAAAFWERLVRMVVARPEWRTFYEADERGACDEVMIDYMAALQARIDASAKLAASFDPTSGSGRARTFIGDLGAALGVDPQKEEQQ